MIIGIGGSYGRGRFGLTEAQMKALERKKERREANGEIETEHPGYPGSRDTYTRVAFAMKELVNY